MKKIELPIHEKIARLLRHDSQCASENTGVCNCYFFEVAEKLTKLFRIELKSL